MSILSLAAESFRQTCEKLGGSCTSTQAVEMALKDPVLKYTKRATLFKYVSNLIQDPNSNFVEGVSETRPRTIRLKKHNTKPITAFMENNIQVEVDVLFESLPKFNEETLVSIIKHINQIRKERRERKIRDDRIAQLEVDISELDAKLEADIAELDAKILAYFEALEDQRL